MQSFEDFYNAVEKEDVARIKEFIDSGCDLNALDENRATVIFFAVLQGNREIVRVLLEHGANADVRVEEPAASILTEKPLDLAQQLRFLWDWEKYHPIVKLLEEFGATDFEGNVDFAEEKLHSTRKRAPQYRVNN